MTWVRYLEQSMPGATQGAIAEAAGVDQPSVSRWRREEGCPSAETAIRLARRLQPPPTQALIAAGHLTPAEVDAQVTYTTPADLSDDELVELLRSRLIAARDRRRR